MVIMSRLAQDLTWCESARQSWQHARAVLARSPGQGGADDLCDRRHEVGLAGGQVAPGSRRNDAGPAHHERHPVAAFPNVALPPGQVGAGQVAVLAHRLHRRPVVAREDDDRLPGDAVPVEGLEDGADRIVYLGDEVPVVAGSAPSPV